MNGIKYSFDKLIHHIDILKKKAQNSHLYYKHSACVLKGSRILSVGINHFIAGKDFSIHAEIDAIYKLPISVKGLDILVIRIDSRGNLQNSRPCNCCIEKLIKKGFRKVFYSSGGGDIFYEFLDNMDKIHLSSGTNYRLRHRHIV